MKPSSLLALLFVAAAAIPSLAAPVLAAPLGAPAAPEVRVVSYADLNLASPAGRARLDQRLRTAVREVCGSTAPHDLRGRAEIALCRAETLALANAARPVTGEVLIAELAPNGTADFR